MKQQGKWVPSEDASLIQFVFFFCFSFVCLVDRRLNGCDRAVADLGQAWEKVSARVGRMSADCRDRYRNHLANREVRVSGTSQPVFFRISYE
jgi:hypothetical protein